MNSDLDLRQKIKNRAVYLGALNEFRRRCRINGLSCYILGFMVGAALSVIIQQALTHLGSMGFVMLIGSIGLSFWGGVFFLFRVLDLFDDDGYTSFMSNRLWKKEKKLSIFNCYEDTLAFFEDCKKLDEYDVANYLKSIYEFSLEETDLFKECLVYREELGYWPKFLLKMSDEIHNARLAGVRLEISSLEGLNSNVKGEGLDSIAEDKIGIKSKVTSLYLRNIQNQELG